MLTPMQELKQTRYFRLVDIDKNGYIEKSDWVKIGDNLAAIRGIAKGSDIHQAIQTQMDVIWNNLREYADKNNDFRISLEEWLTFEDEKVINCDEEWYDSYVNNIVRGLFAVLDANGDGVIGLDEYIHLMVSFRVQPSDAVEAFHKLDSDHNGEISKDELISAVREFHRGSDPDTPGNWLFGPYWKAV
jgi:Ca2+-binding EF-hand superfamily protein